MVTEDNSCSRGCEFESQRCMLHAVDIFFTLICCKNCNDVCLKRPKINEKEAGVAKFFKTKIV